LVVEKNQSRGQENADQREHDKFFPFLSVQQDEENNTHRCQVGGLGHDEGGEKHTGNIKPAAVFKGVKEKEECGKEGEKVEQVRGHPPDVNPGDRREYEDQGEREALVRGVVSFEQQVSHEDGEVEHEAVEEQDAAGTEQPEEGCGKEGIHEGFGIGDIVVGPFLFFQIDTRGTAGEVILDAFDILAFVFDVQVVGQALGDGEIAGLVGEKAPPVFVRDIGPEGEEYDKQCRYRKKDFNVFSHYRNPYK